MSNNSIIRNIDWLTVLIYLCLISVGLLNIYAVDYSEVTGFSFSFSNSYTRQFIWVCIALIAAVSILMIDSRFFISVPYILYGVLLLGLIATLLWGTTVSGTKAWLDLGFFRLQVSEFGKFITALVMAKYLTNYGVSMSKFKNVLFAFAIIILPVTLILLQGDTGSSLVYMSLVLVMYRQGLSQLYIVLPVYAGILFVLTLLYNEVWVIVALGVLAMLLIILFFKKAKVVRSVITGLILSAGMVFGVDYAFENIFKPHQVSRINVLLGKNPDIQGAGYNIHQSLIAIGSGGLQGKGYLNGTQTKFNFVPEQNTDFIFCAVAEEHGFIGSTIVITLFLLLMIRLIILAENQKSKFSLIFGYAVAGIIFLHFMVNIGMTLALFPVVGIPLPFISYGGSSVLAFTILLFIFLKFDASKQTYSG